MGVGAGMGTAGGAGVGVGVGVGELLTLGIDAGARRTNMISSPADGNSDSWVAWPPFEQQHMRTTSMTTTSDRSDGGIASAKGLNSWATPLALAIAAATAADPGSENGALV